MHTHIYASHNKGGVGQSGTYVQNQAVRALAVVDRKLLASIQLVQVPVHGPVTSPREDTQNTQPNNSGELRVRCRRNRYACHNMART